MRHPAKIKWRKKAVSSGYLFTIWKSKKVAWHWVAVWFHQNMGRIGWRRWRGTRNHWRFHVPPLYWEGVNGQVTFGLSWIKGGLVVVVRYG